MLGSLTVSSPSNSCWYTVRTCVRLWSLPTSAHARVRARARRCVCACARACISRQYMQTDDEPAVLVGETSKPNTFKRIFLNKLQSEIESELKRSDVLACNYEPSAQSDSAAFKEAQAFKELAQKHHRDIMIHWKHGYILGSLHGRIAACGVESRNQRVGFTDTGEGVIS